MQLRTDRDLLSFMEELMEYLRTRQELDLADLLGHANRYREVSTEEYLNEAELALKSVLNHRRRVLSGEREDEIRQVVLQIDEWFRDGGVR